MYVLFIEFEAALYDKNAVDRLQKDINTDISHLKGCLPMMAGEVNFFSRQTSEMEFATGIQTTYLQIRIQCQLKQLSNFHHAAQMLQGYFGLLGSRDDLYSPVTTIL